MTRIGDFKAGETREVAVNLAAATAGLRTADLVLEPTLSGGSGGRRPADPPAETSWTRFGSGFNFARLEMAGLTLMGWLDGSLVELDVVDARPAEVRSTLLINSLPIHLSKGWEGELPAWAEVAGGSSAPPPSTASSSAATTSPTASRSRCSSACREQQPIPDRRAVRERRRPLPRRRGRRPGAGRGLLYNWRSAEWEDRIIGLGGIW